jgi:glucosamine kinase
VEVLLGIDGGGTRTRAVLVTPQGRVLGQGEAGPSNYHNTSLNTVAGNLRRATEQAWTATGRAFAPASRAYLGCAGIKTDADAARVRAAAEGIGLAPAGQIEVVNDLHNALAGGLGGAPGIALIAGTGTNCLGRDASGKTFMCGGWGWLLDDEGGGFGLALAAMRAAVRAADGRAPTTELLPAVLAFLGVREANALLERLYVQPWRSDEIAAFAPVVIRLAEAGDTTARGILRQGAAALAELVAGAAQQLDFPENFDVVVLGGCARSGPPYQPLVEAAIRRRCPSAKLVEPIYPPVHGAALNVLRAAVGTRLPKLEFSTS